MIIPDLLQHACTNWSTTQLAHSHATFKNHWQTEDDFAASLLNQLLQALLAEIFLGIRLHSRTKGKFEIVRGRIGLP